MNKNPNVAYAGLVQKYVGTAYDVVKDVHDTLGHFKGTIRNEGLFDPTLGNPTPTTAIYPSIWIAQNTGTNPDSGDFYQEGDFLFYTPPLVEGEEGTYNFMLSGSSQLLEVNSENVTLTAAQTTVVFPTVSTTGAAIYLSSSTADNGRLHEGIHYTVVDSTTITLLTVYPENSIVTSYNTAITVTNQVANLVLAQENLEAELAALTASLTTEINTSISEVARLDLADLALSDTITQNFLALTESIDQERLDRIQGNDDLIQNTSITYISALDGTAIKNSAGTLRLVVRRITNGVITTLTEDPLNTLQDPQFYVEGVPVGREPIFGGNDINGRVVVELRDGVDVLDSVSLIDITDIANTVQVGFELLSGRLAWTKAANGGAWDPVTTESTIQFTWFKDGASIATNLVQITLNPTTGTLSGASISATGETTIVSNVGQDSPSLTIVATHVDSGVKVSESFIAVQGGDVGDQGDTIQVMILSDNGYNFKNNTGPVKTLTPYVYINGVLSTVPLTYSYRWLSNNNLVYASSSGDYLSVSAGAGRFPADPNEVGGMNFPTLKIDFTDVADGAFLNITCEVSGI